MHIVHHHRKPLNNVFSIVWFFLWYRISDRSKRMFVLASLYGQLNQCDGRDTMKLSQVNQRLRLSRCRSVMALKFPTAVSGRVWGRVFPIERLNLDHKEVLVSRLVKKTPCWLWYADNETRHRDIRELIDYCEEQMQAA